jgi:hypothetical protein
MHPVRGATRKCAGMRRSRIRWALVGTLAAVSLGASTANAQEPPAAPPEQAAPAEPAAANPAPAAATPSATARSAKPESKVAAARAAAEAPPTPSERAWIRAELKVNFRASASPSGRALGVLTTGEGVGVIERKNGWARIVVGESTIGWLPESYLDTEPPPKEHVAQLEAQVADLQKNLDEAEREASSLRGQVAELSGKDAERDELIRRMREENRDLRAGERWPYLVTGAGILGIGITVGLFLRGSSRRSYSRLRY